MNTEILSVIIILTAVIIFFITGWIKMDLVALLLPLSLVITGLVTAGEVFSGFSSSAVITVSSLFVITTGLVRTGIVYRVADSLNRFTGKSRKRLLLAGTILPGFMAGFIIVTATVLFFIPTLMRMALQSKIARSRLLLPLAASCLMGANLSLIGTSHNLVVNSMIEIELGFGFSFFEFLPMGLILLFISVLYSLFIGWRLLPGSERMAINQLNNGVDLVKTYDLDDRLWELWVQDRSSASGKSMVELGLGEYFGLCVVAVVRSEEQLPADFNDLRIQGGDVLLVLGKEEQVSDLAAKEGLFMAGHPKGQKRFPLSTAELVEVVVPPRSPVIGKSLVDIHLRENTGLSGIALWRNGSSIRTDVGNIRLQEGDGILLFGDRKVTRSFKPGNNFRWLHPPRKEEAPIELRPYGPLAILILLLVISTAALGFLPLPVAAVTGAAAMVLFGIIRPLELYKSVDWKIIIMIGCLYPLGFAIQNSGASALLAENLLLLGSYNPLAVLAIIAAICILLTQPLHNVAAAVIMTPVALNAALALNIDPKPFLMTVIVGCSAAFMFPTGHPVMLLIQKPGGYHIKDYLKFGSGLCLLVFITIVLAIPLIWPFYP